MTLWVWREWDKSASMCLQLSSKYGMHMLLSIPCAHGCPSKSTCLIRSYTWNLHVPPAIGQAHRKCSKVQTCLVSHEQTLVWFLHVFLATGDAVLLCQGACRASSSSLSMFWWQLQSFFIKVFWLKLPQDKLHHFWQISSEKGLKHICRLTIFTDFPDPMTIL